MARVSRTTANQLRATLNRLAMSDAMERLHKSPSEVRREWKTNKAEQQLAMRRAAEVFATGTQNLSLPIGERSAQTLSRLGIGRRHGLGAMSVEQVLRAAGGRGQLTPLQLRAMRFQLRTERELNRYISENAYGEEVRTEWIREGWYHTPGFYERERESKWGKLRPE